MEKIVAAEIGAGGLELFCRTGDGATVKAVQNFAPWCLAPAGVEPPQGVEMKVLAGGGKFNCRWEFPSVAEYEKCESDLKKNPELMLLRDMVQQGLFGDLVHAEASYIHDLRDRISSNDEGHRRWINWQVEYMATHIANFYPTHGLGPVALALGIHRGDRMKSLVSVSSRAIGEADKFRGTMNSSIITTEKGRTILLQHGIALPRPYSRSFLLSGTKGYVQKYPAPYMAFAPDTTDVLSGERCEALAEEYRHPFVAEYKERGEEICGKRWIDFIMDNRLIYCLRNGLPLDMDVYDAVEWSVLVELTEQSAMMGGVPVEIPDFTRGEWERVEGFKFAVKE